MDVIVTLIGRDSFANEFTYEITVKNRSADWFDADALLLVLEQITDLAGKNALGRMEVVGQDGETTDGQPFFKIPKGRMGRFAPYATSPSIIVRLRNVAYTVLFTPRFRVLGRPIAGSTVSTTALIRMLLEKGLISEEDVTDLIVRESGR